MVKLFNKKKLPVVSPKSRYAELVMIASHREDHRANHHDAVWRSRKHCWIVRGQDLAKRVIANCQLCIIKNRKLQEQRMGDLPPVIFDVPCRPFSHISMDFYGPHMVSSMTGGRTKLKTFTLIIVCLNTGAINLVLCAGYSTKEFLISFKMHCADFGNPRFVYTDPGTQLLAARKVVGKADGEIPDIDWRLVADTTALSKVVWKTCPAQSQWRNAHSEIMVKAVKHTERMMEDGVQLSYQERMLLLRQAVRCINNRPIGDSRC